MARLHPKSFIVALVLLGLMFAGEIWWAIERRGAALNAEMKLARKGEELRQLQAKNPAPTPAAAAAIEADVAQTAEVLAAAHAALEGHGPFAEQFRAAQIPAKRTDAFFDLAAFAERMRERAASFQVNLKTDESFGFSAYAHEGPEEELIPAVFRQRIVIQYLLEALFEARPYQLLGVQRGRPRSSGELRPETFTEFQRSPSSAGAAEASLSDFLAIDRRISAWASGSVEAMAFRIAFTGHTASLRRFLNKLGTFELPLVVCSVEVEPVASTGRESRASAVRAQKSVLLVTEPGDPAPVPLVTPGLSKFTVAIELIERRRTSQTASLGRPAVPNI